MAGDLVVLNVLIILFCKFHPHLMLWKGDDITVLWAVCNLAMIMAQWKYSTIIHLRFISGGDILKRVFNLTVLQTLIVYLAMVAINVGQPAGWIVLQIGLCQMVVLVCVRVGERYAIKCLRQRGKNVRMVIFVGADTELLSLYRRMKRNPAYGYRVVGYYADEEMPHGRPGEDFSELRRLGSLMELMEGLAKDQSLNLGDEMYACLSRRDGEILRELSEYCDQRVVHFYYLPKSVESVGMHLRRELFDDMEVFTTHEIPMENSVSMVGKRIFDIIVSFIALLLMLPFLPIVSLIIKIQSPGPIFFRQERTGGNGRNFMCYKFRSMHLNQDADIVQATEDDPRKFPFGNIMRKFNIDELPQFWNVLKGDMSVVGPRPHMLYHTEFYKRRISKYMVRHFVKPGITGWAQVTGFRGETKELWQMEERVKRDIWYIEHWSFWLDLRIIWLTIKTTIIHDKHAY